eukprot:gene26881-biopygen17466
MSRGGYSRPESGWNRGSLPGE